MLLEYFFIHFVTLRLSEPKPIYVPKYQLKSISVGQCESNPIPIS